MARKVAHIQQAKLFSHQSESKRSNMRKRNYMCCTLLGLVIAAPFAFAAAPKGYSSVYSTKA